MVRRTRILVALMLAGAALAGLSAAGVGSTGARSIELSVLGTYETGIFAGGAQEIVSRRSSARSTRRDSARQLGRRLGQHALRQQGPRA